MDNNVLYSKRFNEIIDDIKEIGFYKGATFGKTKKKRFVDFNQGLDARLLTEKKMKKLAEIPLEPMRLAFDDIDYEDHYIKAVKLANQYGQKNMSNYILYNFKDTPEDFYKRLKINIDLNEEFKQDSLRKRRVKTVIYSFPMRYIPLKAKDRKVETGNRFWNKRYLRGVQVILSVIKGPVMTGRQFFEQAFGRNSEEFKEIILMPDEFIRNRVKYNWGKIRNYSKRLMPYVKSWKDIYSRLNDNEKKELEDALKDNRKEIIEKYHNNTESKRVKKLLGFHIKANEIVGKHKNGI
jgi:hypothetical protein